MSRKGNPDKITPWLYVVVGAIVLVVALMVGFLKPTPAETFYNVYTGNGALHLAEDHVYKEISFRKFMKMVDQEDMLVFIGEPTCGECLQEVHLYDLEFKEAELGEHFDYIYYLNVNKIKDKQEEEFSERFHIDFEITPWLLYFEDGEIKESRYDMKFDTPLIEIQGIVYKFYNQVKINIQKKHD